MSESGDVLQMECEARDPSRAIENLFEKNIFFTLKYFLFFILSPKTASFFFVRTTSYCIAYVPPTHTVSGLDDSSSEIFKDSPTRVPRESNPILYNGAHGLILGATLPFLEGKCLGLL